MPTSGYFSTITDLWRIYQVSKSFSIMPIRVNLIFLINFVLLVVVVCSLNFHCRCRATRPSPRFVQPVSYCCTQVRIKTQTSQKYNQRTILINGNRSLHFQFYGIWIWIPSLKSLNSKFPISYGDIHFEWHLFAAHAGTYVFRLIWRRNGE